MCKAGPRRDALCAYGESMTTLSMVPGHVARDIAGKEEKRSRVLPRSQVALTT